MLNGLKVLRTSSLKQVGIVVPSFNEERNLIDLLEQFSTLAKSYPAHYTVVVIDDGSEDGTHSLMRSLMSSLTTQTINAFSTPSDLSEGTRQSNLRPNLGPTLRRSGDGTVQFSNGSTLLFEYVRLPINLGIGKAVQTGLYFLLDRGVDIFLQVDGDGQHPPSEIPKLLVPLIQSKIDICVGSRYLPEDRTNVSSSWREWGTRYFSFLIHFLTGRKIYDVTSGFRAFSRPLVLQMVREYPDDFPEVQAYVVLHRISGGHSNPNSFKVLEVPVKMARRKHGSSSITPTKIIYYMLKVTLATVLERFRGSLRPRSAMLWLVFLASQFLISNLVYGADSLMSPAPTIISDTIISGTANSGEVPSGKISLMAWKDVPGNRLRIEFWAIAACVGLGVTLLELVRRKKILERYSLLWFLTLAVVLTLTWRREWLSGLATTLGIHYPPTALLLVFVFFQMSILIHFSMVISRLLQEKQTLAQSFGLLEAKVAKLERESAVLIATESAEVSNLRKTGSDG